MEIVIFILNFIIMSDLKFRILLLFLTYLILKLLFLFFGKILGFLR